MIIIVTLLDVLVLASPVGIERRKSAGNSDMLCAALCVSGDGHRALV